MVMLVVFLSVSLRSVLGLDCEGVGMVGRCVPPVGSGVTIQLRSPLWHLRVDVVFFRKTLV